ncbi:MAG: dihydrofolate reductase [Planctomycetota bacterium]|nr:MAG: dihydrofolate reductase [Planctomycetota bacterium]
MQISLISAMSQNRVLSQQGKIPWKIPWDLQNFKRLTLFHHILMGRKTWQSLPHRPLPQRVNMILSRRPRKKRHQRGLYFTNLREALNYAQNQGETELFVIGGEEIFRLTLPLAYRMYLTIVHKNMEGDRFFPTFSQKKWAVIQSITMQENNYTFTYQELERFDERKT